MSANLPAQPHPTGDIRPFSGRLGTGSPEVPDWLHPVFRPFAPRRIDTASDKVTDRRGPPQDPGTVRPGGGPSCTNSRATTRTNSTRTQTPSPIPARRTTRRTARRAVRETRLASRTGPPPAGNEAAASPSPQCPMRRADPRSTHGSASVRTGRERTAGRTATREEHARTPGTGLSQGPDRACEPWLSAPPGTRIRPGQRGDKGRGPQARARTGRSARAVPRTPRPRRPRTFRPPPLRPSGVRSAPVRSLRLPHPSASPPLPLRSAFTSSPPAAPTSITQATHTSGAPTAHRCSPRLPAAGRRSTRFATRGVRADNNPAIRTSAP